MQVLERGWVSSNNIVFIDLRDGAESGAAAQGAVVDTGIVRGWDEAALHLTSMGQECARFDFDATFTQGDRLTLGGMAWRAIASPGHHTASQMLYSEEARILISADALWENGFGVIFPEIDGDRASQGEAFAAQRATLDAIAALKVDTVIPGHGAPFAGCAGALERAYSRLDYFTATPERHARNGLKVTLAEFTIAELEKSRVARRAGGWLLLAS